MGIGIVGSLFVHTNGSCQWKDSRYRVEAWGSPVISPTGVLSPSASLGKASLKNSTSFLRITYMDTLLTSFSPPGLPHPLSNLWPLI